MPDANSLVAGGRQLCDRVDGELRVSLPELRPAPLQVLDDPLDQWISHAVGIVLECSDDAAMVNQQLETLAILAAEIDGALSLQS